MKDRLNDIDTAIINNKRKIELGFYGEMKIGNTQ